MDELLLDLPQGNVAYLHNGYDPTRPNILAVHGWLDNAASFSPLFEFLGDYNVVAIDLPGHGHSFHRPQHCHYHFIDWVSDLYTITQALLPEREFTLLGHSLGGMLSTVFASMFPEQVKNLILIDAAGLVTQNDQEAASEMKKALLSRIKLADKSMRTHPTQTSAINARLAAGDLSEFAGKLLVERNLKAVEGGFEWRTDQRLRTGSPVRINSATAAQIIEQIKVPTAIILAEDGYDSVKQNYQKFQHYYANAEQFSAPGGHHCHMDYPQSIADIIKRFV